MKNVTIAGRIGRSAELRRTQSGDPVASFSVAVDDRSGPGQYSHRVYCF
jgi:single-stranded DNA-binding protein